MICAQHGVVFMITSEEALKLTIYVKVPELHHIPAQFHSQVVHSYKPGSACPCSTLRVTFRIARSHFRPCTIRESRVSNAEIVTNTRTYSPGQND